MRENIASNRTMCKIHCAVGLLYQIVQVTSCALRIKVRNMLRPNFIEHFCRANSSSIVLDGYQKMTFESVLIANGILDPRVHISFSFSDHFRPNGLATAAVVNVNLKIPA